MKKIILLFSLPLLLLTALQHTANAQTDVTVSYQAFYDELSPYGQWINDPEYGYVWIPNENDDFRPYFSGGHWAMTEYGNTWVSDYSWGWACFHYGRWVYNDYYGWIWIPGYEWGPGWVAWRWGDGFCGWAPLYPGFVWAGEGYSCPEDWWIFMPPRHIYKPHYSNVWRSDFIHGPHHTHHIIERTHYITNTFGGRDVTYYSGPRTSEVQQVTHKPVPVYHLNNVSARGQDHISSNVLNNYHPARIEPLKSDGTRPVPAQVMQAPQPVGAPADVKVKWDQPRPFKETMQQQNPTIWNRPFIRNEPPYSPRPAAPGGNVRPNAAPPARQPAPQPRSNPAPRSSPAPAPRRK